MGYFMKPVAKEAIDGALIKIESLLQSQVKQLLVVEDDQKTQIAVQCLLRTKDIHITIAGNGTVALKELASTRFDRVILDPQSPDMNGFEWLQRMDSRGWRTRLLRSLFIPLRELTEEENYRLSRMHRKHHHKGAKSPERLLDEATLFQHSVESRLSSDQQDIVRMQHNPDQVLQGRTLLLVDDDLRNTFALSKLLSKHHLNIVIADNGQMALEKLKENRIIELIIMEIMMPVMDGYEAMRAIRSQRSLREVPIIALTARPCRRNNRNAWQRGPTTT